MPLSFCAFVASLAILFPHHSQRSEYSFCKGFQLRKLRDHVIGQQVGNSLAAKDTDKQMAAALKPLLAFLDEHADCVQAFSAKRSERCVPQKSVYMIVRKIVSHLTHGGKVCYNAPVRSGVQHAARLYACLGARVKCMISLSACRAYQQGMARYKDGLPPTYTEAVHRLALLKAIQRFQVLARGPASRSLKNRLRQAGLLVHPAGVSLTLVDSLSTGAIFEDFSWRALHAHP